MNIKRIAALSLLLPAISVPALTATATAAPAASERASLALSASTGLPGASVTFHGMHFRKHEKVALHWSSAKGAVLKTVTASAAGKISGTFTVPSPNGKVKTNTAVVAVGAKDRKTAKARFRQACTDAWAAKGSGSWTTAKDWSTKAVPGGSDVACITVPRSKSYTVSLTSASGGATVDALVVGSTAGSHTQTLKLAGSGADLHLATTAGTVVEKHGALNLGLGTGGGNTFLDGGAIANYGLISNTGNGWSRYYGAPVVNEAGGTFSDSVACTNCDAYINANFTNDGTIKLGTGATFTTGGIAFTQNAGVVQNSGSLIVNGGSFVLKNGTATGKGWLLRNGVAMNDVGTAKGIWAFEDSGTLTGNVRAGQAIVVDGDGGSDVKLQVPSTLINNGTIDLTSDSGYNGQTNSWLVPAGNSAATLDNYGVLETSGSGYSRYFLVNIDNEVGGNVALGNPGPDTDVGARNILGQNQGGGSTIFTNDGTLTIADGANLDVTSSVYGQGDFVQGSGGTLNVTEDTTHGTQSLLHQTGCSAGACQNEYVDLGGTLDVTTIGSAATFVPMYSDAYAFTGTFAQLTGTPEYVASENVPEASLGSPPGDVSLAPAP